ncbi:unnamed protein product, partial [Gulo gulo]
PPTFIPIPVHTHTHTFVPGAHPGLRVFAHAAPRAVYVWEYRADAKEKTDATCKTRKRGVLLKTQRDIHGFCVTVRSSKDGSSAPSGLRSEEPGKCPLLSSYSLLTSEMRARPASSGRDMPTRMYLTINMEAYDV